MAESDLLYSDLTREIIGAAMEVHSNLGSGFLESVYEAVFAYELDKRGINYTRQQGIKAMYEDIVLDIGEGDRIIGIEILDASKHVLLERLLPVKYELAGA